MADGPLTAEQLARATQAHEPSLYRVLRLLASLGVLTEHGNRSFGLTVLGERLRAHVPASMRSWAMLVESLDDPVGSGNRLHPARFQARPGQQLAILGVGPF